MSKTISGLPLAETLTGNELLPVVQDGNTVQSTVQQVADLVGNTATWGDIQGTLSNQTDLQTALDNKYSTSNPAGYITASALTGYAPLNSPTFTGTVGGITKSMVGLGNVDNTADANKSVNYANTAGSASNSDTVDGYHIQVDGTGTNPNTIYFKTTGGVDPSQAIWGDITGSIVDQTDLYNALVTGSYATGNWNINASSVDGYSVQVDGTGTDPNTIYFKTTGGTISVDWDDVSNTPTTVAGYGITDVFTETESDARFLGISATAVNSDKIDGYHVQVDGTGTDPNTIYFKTTGGTTSVAWGDISGTLSAQTDLQTELDGKYSTANPSGYITASALTPYAPLNNPTFTGTVSGITKAMVGLGNVDNTADAVKSVSYATSSGNADTVDGYNVQVDGTGTDPNTIYFKTTGGSISVDWDDVSNTPTTITGYGITDAVTTSGNQTVGGTKTFSSTITGSITGNAGTVTNGVYTSGDQTIGGNKNFSSTIIGSVSGNAGTVTNGVYTTGDQTIGGAKTFTALFSPTLAVGTNNTSVATTAFVNAEIANDAPSKTGTGASGTWGIDITGNANTVDGYHVQVDGTGTDPNTIYFKTTGGSVSVEWDDVSNTPTTVAGYGITDAVTTSGNQTIGGTKTFSSDVILSGGTANGVLYLTGSKYVTSGSTLVFNGSQLGINVSSPSYSLDVAGTFNIASNGSSNTATINHTSGSGIALNISKGGNNEAIYVNKTSGSGNAVTVVGTVQATSFVGALTGNASTVTNGVYTTGDQTIAGIKTFSGASTIVGGNFNLSGGTANGVTYLNGSKNLATGSALTFNGSGLGIGTSAVAGVSLLDVETGSGRIQLRSGANTGGTGSGTGIVSINSAVNAIIDLNYRATNHAWVVNSSEAMRLTSTGLGIGTTSPTGKLEVYGTGALSWGVLGNIALTGNVTVNSPSGGSFAVRTPSLNDSYQSGLGVDGTYNGGKSVVNLKAFGVYSGGPYSSDLAFYTTSTTTSSEKMRIDSAGNVGIGVTPSAWQDSFRALQIGFGASVAGRGTGNNEAYLTSNSIFDATDVRWEYQNSGFASQYLQISGQHRWYTAPSGTAGNVISFTQAMTLDASGNLGIGTSSPASTAGITLSKTSNVAYEALLPTVASIAFGYNNSGSANAWGAPTGTAFFGTPQAVPITFTTGAVERMRITSAGNVGIGTSSPSFRLTTNYTAPATFTNAVGDFTQMWQAGGTNALGVAFSTGDKYARFVVNNDYKFAWNYASIDIMTLNTSGNLGIGITSPLAKLDANGNIRTSAGSGGTITAFDNNSSRNNRAILGADANGAYLDSTYSNAGTGTITFRTIGTERVRISEAGNVGIGTSSPASKLQVTDGNSVNTITSLFTQGNSDAGFRAGFANGSGTTTGTEQAKVGLFYSGVTNPVTHIGFLRGGGADSVGLTFNVNTTERMRIDSSGKVLVGAGATASLGKLVVSEASSGTAVIALESQGSWNSQISSTSAGNMIFSNGTNERMRINASGDVGIGTSSPSQKLEVGGSILASGNVTAYSDIRVKDNVESIEGAIGKLNQIRGVTYTRTDLDDKQRRFAGVIAQEIEQVLPEAVFDNGRVKAVDYNATIALLIEAVKEQQGQINELKLTIEQLKGN
jgi:hypothetical protein